MKIMRKIIGILAVLLICTAFVGAGMGAAFTVTKNVAVNPSGVVSPNDKVTAKVTLEIPPNSLGITEEINLKTDLTNAVWTIKVYQSDNKIPVTTLYTPVLSGLVLYYPDQKVTLDVSLTGYVSQADKGEKITVLEIDATDTKNGGKYLSSSQYVNDPDDLKSDIEKLNTRVKTIESRINVYAGYGFDTTSLTQKVTQAKSYINVAVNSGSSDVSKAFSNINSAISVLNDVEMTFAKTGLTASKTNMDQIERATTTLYERGWKSEAQLLETRNTRMEITYNSLESTYKSGSAPDAVKLDELVADSYETLAEANEYLEDSKMPKIVKFLPIIIGVIVAVAAVVGIVFLIRRRRANSWDELG